MPKSIINCPHCGSAVKAVTSDEGHYEPLTGATAANEIEALRNQLARAEEVRENANRATLRAERNARVLADTLSEAIDDAEEGWAYASDYFREKWDCEGEIAKRRAVLERYRRGEL